MCNCVTHLFICFIYIAFCFENVYNICVRVVSAKLYIIHICQHSTSNIYFDDENEKIIFKFCSFKISRRSKGYILISIFSTIR